MSKFPQLGGDGVGFWPSLGRVLSWRAWPLPDTTSPYTVPCSSCPFSFSGSSYFSSPLGSFLRPPRGRVFEEPGASACTDDAEIHGGSSNQERQGELSSSAKRKERGAFQKPDW